MPRRESEPIERIHVSLFHSDVEWLRERFTGNVRVSKAVRLMIRKAIQRVMELEASKARPVQIADEDFPELGEE